MKPALKYGIIAAAWIVYLIIGLSGNSNDNTATTGNNTETIVSENETINDDVTTNIVEVKQIVRLLSRQKQIMLTMK